ncbi:MAG: hypothetical protein ACOYM2_19920 [Rectinemataceae bacterium]
MKERIEIEGGFFSGFGLESGYLAETIGSPIQGKFIQYYPATALGASIGLSIPLGSFLRIYVDTVAAYAGNGRLAYLESSPGSSSLDLKTPVAIYDPDIIGCAGTGAVLTLFPMIGLGVGADMLFSGGGIGFGASGLIRVAGFTIKATYMTKQAQLSVQPGDPFNLLAMIDLTRLTSDYLALSCRYGIPLSFP